MAAAPGRPPRRRTLPPLPLPLAPLLPLWTGSRRPIWRRCAYEVHPAMAVRLQLSQRYDGTHD
jgi:hypothetical protein